MLKSLTAKNTIFGLIDGARENLKIILRVIEDMSIALDRVHQVVLGTRVERVGTIF
jgi:hypothetical protein